MRITSGLRMRMIEKLLDSRSLQMLNFYSEFNPRPITIKQFLEFGRTATEEESFNFLRKEMPVRLSNIMKEMNLLPTNLLQMPSVLFLQALMKLRSRHSYSIISGTVRTNIQRSG